MTSTTKNGRTVIASLRTEDVVQVVETVCELTAGATWDVDDIVREALDYFSGLAELWTDELVDEWTNQDATVEAISELVIDLLGVIDSKRQLAFRF